MGYEHAKTYLHNYPGDGEVMDNQVTKTPDTGEVISFRGTFVNRIEWGGKSTKLRYYVYFRFAEHTEQEYHLDLFSSVFIANLRTESPVFFHIIRKRNTNGNIILEAEADLIISGTAYRLRVEWVLKGAISYMMGLEFKKSSFLIYPKSGVNPKPVCECVLYQSFLNRVKALLSTHLRRRDGTNGGLLKKYAMMSKFMDYEV
jgi:hypothetical protein